MFPAHIPLRTNTSLSEGEDFIATSSSLIGVGALAIAPESSGSYGEVALSSLRTHMTTVKAIGKTRVRKIIEIGAL